MSPDAVPESAVPGGTAPDAVHQRIGESYQLLAALYESVGEADPESVALARQHVTNATRELAAVQRLFERRGR